LVCACTILPPRRCSYESGPFSAKHVSLGLCPHTVVQQFTLDHVCPSRNKSCTMDGEPGMVLARTTTTANRGDGNARMLAPFRNFTAILDPDVCLCGMTAAWKNRCESVYVCPMIRHETVQIVIALAHFGARVVGRICFCCRGFSTGPGHDMVAAPRRARAHDYVSKRNQQIACCVFLPKPFHSRTNRQCSAIRGSHGRDRRLVAGIQATTSDGSRIFCLY
jgi:hypothetical protein